MKYFIFFTLFYLLSTFQILTAQAPDTLWTKIFGQYDDNQGTAVLQTQNGHFLIGGKDMFGPLLICLDNNGNQLWSKNWLNDTTFGDPYTSIFPEIYELNTNNFVFGHGGEAGMVWYNHLADSTTTIIYDKGGWGIGFTPVTFKKIPNDGYMLAWNEYGGWAGWGCQLKVDLCGDTLWYKNYGGGGWQDLLWFYDVESTNDGGSIIFGGSSDAELVLLKKNALGDSIWTKSFNDTTKNFYGISVLQTQDNDYMLLVNFYDDTTQGLILYKTDEDGDTLWSKNLGFSGNEDIKMMKSTPDGGFILVGSTDNQSAYSDLLIVKIDSLGNTQWSKTMGGNSADFASDVNVASDGSYIIVGTTYSFSAHHNIWVVRLEPEPVGIESNSDDCLPADYYLLQNYPNPFNPNTNFEFSIPKTEYVTLIIYNLLGQEVTTLVSDKLNSGSYKYTWDASGFASGIYYYKIETAEYFKTRKLILLK